MSTATEFLTDPPTRTAPAALTWVLHSRVLAVVWLAMRVWLGIMWIQAGWAKLWGAENSAFLHHDGADRRLAELEAESTAFVVCRSLGLDTGLYSFGYVATWAGGGEAAVAGIRASCGRIQHAAGVILDQMGSGQPVAHSPAA